MVELLCDYCGEPFEASGRTDRSERFCSRACYMTAPRSGRAFKPVACAGCGEMFKPTHSMRPAYCSEDCRNPIVACPQCGVDFRPRQRGQQTYCSRPCAYAALTVPRIRQDGYVSIMVPKGTPGRRSDGRMMEHRYVMQEYLGRPLRSTETVHHRDCNRENNAIENLELWIGNHGRGASSAHCESCTCFEGATRAPAAA